MCPTSSVGATIAMQHSEETGAWRRLGVVRRSRESKSPLLAEYTGYDSDREPYCDTAIGKLMGARSSLDSEDKVILDTK